MGATGTATLDFGSFPGSSHTTVAITGQTSILTTSLVEAWIRPVASTDHTADEHMLETLKVFAADIVAGTGFTIHGFNTNQINEPVRSMHQPDRFVQPSGTSAAQQELGHDAGLAIGGTGTRIYGTWTVAWVWN